MFKFDVYFEILKFTFKKVYNSVADMVSFAPQFKQKNQKASTDCKKVLDAVCTNVTSSAASRDSAVKLTTDSYQFVVAH